MKRSRLVECLLAGLLLVLGLYIAGNYSMAKRLRVSQSALAEATAGLKAMQAEASICRGMIHFQGDEVLQIRVSTQ